MITCSVCGHLNDSSNAICEQCGSDLSDSEDWGNDFDDDNNNDDFDLKKCHCTCNKPTIWKIPCSHIIAVCKVMRTDALTYISSYWSVDTSIAMYGSLSFRPLPDEPYWQPYHGIRTLPNTDRLRGRGRPRVNRIRNEMDDWIESQPAEAGQTCSFCHQSGHNRRTCGRVNQPPGE